MEKNLKQRHIPVKTVCMMRYSSNGCACLLCGFRRNHCTWHSISNNYILILLNNIINQQALITTGSVITENPQFVLTKLDRIYVEVCIRQVVGATGFEPATARPPGVCATRLRYAPYSSYMRCLLYISVKLFKNLTELEILICSHWSD